MQKLKGLFLVFFLSSLFVNAQQGIIKGHVSNGKNNETLPGVNIILDEKTGVTTDVNGVYEFKVNPGKVKLTYKFIGFSEVIKTFDVKPGKEILADIEMFEESMLIEGVVVSAGKFEQKISDVTVSMSVMKPKMIEDNNTNDMEEVLNKVPGLDIRDAQPSIRGGSGYSYGSGSRVLVLVDDLPMLSPDGGAAEWGFLPVENVSQVEVIKGASSALFGSSAMNGVINFRTAYPSTTPQTKFSLNTGIYMNPKREELIWWGEAQPMFGGFNFSHSRIIKKQLDLVVAGHGYNTTGYRQGEQGQQYRGNINLRYRPKKIEGLSFGVNSNFMMQQGTSFFLWKDADSGAWRQTSSSTKQNYGYRFNVDPYITYFGKKGSRHSLKTRFFQIVNDCKNDPAQNNSSEIYYGDYQYQKLIKNKLTWTAGLSAAYGKSYAKLFGNHSSANVSFYSQFDIKFWQRLSLSGGIRLEYYRVDTARAESDFAFSSKTDTLKIPVRPVFRAGLNYQVAKYTFLRASYGQGYRFPSIAEKYVSTDIGGLKIFPNPNLLPENGWSAEIGIKQGVRFLGWNGYIDIAGFWTEYYKMMEFTFGNYTPKDSTPDIKWFGFQSKNVGHARINGVDATFTGDGRIWNIPTAILIGYTFTNPIDLSGDTTSRSTSSNVLKYRYYHSLKGGIEMSFGRFNVGVSVLYSSKIINIDKAFLGPLIPPFPDELLPGLKDYWEKYNKGSAVCDVRVGMDITESASIALIGKNIFNKEYSSRPGSIMPPRNIAIQCSLVF
jgi:iron complex outermembrane receptor protein